MPLTRPRIVPIQRNSSVSLHQNIRVNDIERPEAALSLLVEQCAEIVDPVEAEQSYLIMLRPPSLKRQNIVVPEDRQILIHLDLKAEVSPWVGPERRWCTLLTFACTVPVWIFRTPGR